MRREGRKKSKNAAKANCIWITWIGVFLGSIFNSLQMLYTGPDDSRMASLYPMSTSTPKPQFWCRWTRLGKTDDHGRPSPQGW